MKTQLKYHETYMIWEPGMNEWLEMRYMGYNKLTDEHIFISTEDHEVWIMIRTEDIDDEVK